MKIFLRYTESYLPPRCRKLRQREVDEIVDLTLAALAPAPVAIIERDWQHKTIYYRWHAGRLWRLMRVRPDREADEVPLRADDSQLAYYFHGNRNDNRAQALEWLRQEADRYRVLRGRVWRECGEPRYVVMTFGLGHNHGGTALMTSNSYNSNIHRDRYYRLDQFDQALTEATRVALARGDTRNVPIRPHSRFRVLIPEAVRLHPAAEHGTGDPFINRVEALVEHSPDVTFAGLGALALLAQELKG